MVTGELLQMISKIIYNMDDRAMEDKYPPSPYI